MTDYIEMVRGMTKSVGDSIGEMYYSYMHSKEVIQEEQGNMSDIVHKLEIYRTSNVERQKLATIYANCARRRRRHKEIVELLEPFVGFVTETQLPKRLCDVVGDMQAAKERQAKRQYTPRGKVINFENAEKYDLSYDKNFND